MTEGASADRNETRMAIFNHKGGVGKTTLTVNVAAALAAEGYRVLLVDTDPQCNLTSYLVAAEVVDDLLDNSDGPDGETIWSAVKPVSEALGPVGYLDPVELTIEGLYLVPGDIRLSEFEVDLADFWGECLQRKARGFRGTTAISDMVTTICEEYGIDFVMYDSGPNIGALNRAVLLDCDYFVVPVACDLFSVRALKTLGRTMVEWVRTWSTITELAPEGISLLSGKPAFLGYVPGGFRTYSQEVASQQAYFFSQLDKEIHSQIVVLLRDLDPELVATRKKTRLGEVKHFGALVPASQRSGLPLWEVSAGSQGQRNQARRAFASIASTIGTRVGRG